MSEWVSIEKQEPPTGVPLYLRLGESKRVVVGSASKSSKFSGDEGVLSFMAINACGDGCYDHVLDATDWNLVECPVDEKMIIKSSEYQEYLNELRAAGVDSWEGCE